MCVGFVEEGCFPVKCRTVRGERVEGKGTKDDPFIIHRLKVVDNVYQGWYDDDGGYHETLVKDEE